MSATFFTSVISDIVNFTLKCVSSSSTKTNPLNEDAVGPSAVGLLIGHYWKAKCQQYRA